MINKIFQFSILETENLTQAQLINQKKAYTK